MPIAAFDMPSQYKRHFVFSSWCIAIVISAVVAPLS
jgi:hypothetical protein